MQKIRPALERLHKALNALGVQHHEVGASVVQLQTKQDEFDMLAEQCAHLRGEISALRKANQKLEAQQKRAVQQVEKAMRQIDNILGEKRVLGEKA